MEYDTKNMITRMIKKQAVFKEKAVLEIGCGGGKISLFLANSTKLFIGIDPDKKAIREAKENYELWCVTIGSHLDQY